MKYNKIILCFFLLILVATSCKKYLDINSDPSSPQIPSLASLFPPTTSIMSVSTCQDSRYTGMYIQNFGISTTGTLPEQYESHGGNANTAGTQNQAWRAFYQWVGPSLNLIIKQGIIDEQWDYVGAATTLRAWGLQNATDMFGEMPYYQAWEENRVFFKYDKQEDLYRSVDSLCRKAIEYLSRADGKVSQPIMARGDLVYAGDRAKWTRFVYGILARNWHHQTNKGNYNADSVISYVDKSMQSNSDNFLVKHSATKNDDNPWFSPSRDNLSARRQSKFIVQLLDGTTFTNPINTLPANRDIRLSKMLSASPDTSTLLPNYVSLNGGYRFFLPNNANAIGTSGTALRQTASTLYGDSIILNNFIDNFTVRAGKYLFQSTTNFPIMTYFEMQFIKSEAAFRKGDLITAYNAYKNGIGGHIDFVNSSNTGANGVTQINATDKSNFLMNSPSVKQSPLALTLTDIMLQKYIADFGWNFTESWCDMRRYHYYDIDPITNTNVYKGYAAPNPYSTNNLGPKPAYRCYPWNVENTFNVEELRKVGGLNQDYHTYEMWFSQP
jgi:hypothetical protein